MPKRLIARNTKPGRAARLFLSSASGIFFVTGGAKLLSASSGSAALQTIDPIVGMRVGHLFFIVGVVELVVAAVCFWGRRTRLQAGVLLWVCGALLLYRIGLAWVGHSGSCGCLGSLTSMLGISVVQADRAMKLLLLYLLTGSGLVLWGSVRRTA